MDLARRVLDLAEEYLVRPVQRAGQVALLGISLAGCPSPQCVTDTDCPAGQTCVYDQNVQVVQCSGGEEAVSEPPVCGNSPLTGKYVWIIGRDCDAGGVGPFQRDCTSIFRDEEDAEEGIPVTYQSMTVSNIVKGSRTYALDFFTDIQPSDFTNPTACEYGEHNIAYWESSIQQFICTLSRLRERDPGYFGHTWRREEETTFYCPQLEYFSYLTDTPWPGIFACRDSSPFQAMIDIWRGECSPEGASR